MNKLFSRIALRVETKILHVLGNYNDGQVSCDKCYPLIITNNCWGAEFYQTKNIEYPTPFVGLYIEPEDYLKLLSNFDLLFEEKLKFCKSNGKFPIAYLGEVKINFLHYKSEVEARSKFERRTARLEKHWKSNPIVIKFCDVDGATKQQVEMFHHLGSLIGNAISFSKFDIDRKYAFKIKGRHLIGGKVPNGLHLYKLRYSYFNFKKFLTGL